MTEVDLTDGIFTGATVRAASRMISSARYYWASILQDRHQRGKRKGDRNQSEITQSQAEEGSTLNGNAKIKVDGTDNKGVLTGTYSFNLVNQLR